MEEKSKENKQDSQATKANMFKSSVAADEADEIDTNNKKILFKILEANQKQELE